MNIIEIEKLFDSEEGLNRLLEELNKYFDSYDEILFNIENNTIGNSEETKKILYSICKIYDIFIQLFNMAKEKEETKILLEYEKIRMEHEKNAPRDEKGKPVRFVDSTGEKQASLKSILWTRIRSILQAKLNSCEKNISILQSILAYDRAKIGIERNI